VLALLIAVSICSLMQVRQVAAQTEASEDQFTWLNTNSLSGSMGKVSIDAVVLQSNYTNTTENSYTVEVISVSLLIDGATSGTNDCNNATIQAGETSTLPGFASPTSAGYHSVQITVLYYLNETYLTVWTGVGHHQNSVSYVSWTSPTSSASEVEVQSAAQGISNWLIDVIVGGVAFALLVAALAYLRGGSGKGRRKGHHGIFSPLGWVGCV
jgi:hypothetical protein